MTFRREIDDHIGLLLAEDRVDGLAVADAAARKVKARIIRNIEQGLIVARIRQRINAEDLRLRMRFHHVMDEVAADKTGTAGHKILQGYSSP